MKTLKKKHWLLLVNCLLILLVAGSNLFAATTQLKEGTSNAEFSVDAVFPSIPIPSYSLADGRGITWLGDNWVPPSGCRIYSIPELHAIFSRFSILWVGDSTVRRAYGSLRAILQNNHSSSISMDDVNSPHVIDVNKDSVQEECQKWKYLDWVDPTSLCSTLENGRAFDFIQVRCLKDFPTVLRNIPSLLHADFDLVVVSGGSWDFSPLKRNECSGRKGFPNILWKNLELVLEELRGLQSPSRHVVWRTLAMNQHELEKDVWNQYNERCVHNLTGSGSAANLSSIDVATALEPRSVMYERIEGNNIYHLGLKGRLLFVQMLANHLLLKIDEWNYGSDRRSGRRSPY